MGTRAHLVVNETARHFLEEAIEQLCDWNTRWTRFTESSELAAINRADGRPVMVSPDTATLVALSVDAWHLTEGTFDPTVHDAVVNAGYGQPFSDGPTTPGPPVEVPGAGAIDVDSTTGLVQIPKGVRLDLGGIAKGHAADLLVRQLLERGAIGAAVTIGGDTAVGGECPFADGWPIVTEIDPATPVAYLRQGGFCFSTTQRRRWATARGPAHHIIDPRTGRPAESTITSVAIASSTASTAEVFATASLVAGWPATRRMIDAAALSGFVITEFGERHDFGTLAPTCPENGPDTQGQGGG